MFKEFLGITRILLQCSAIYDSMMVFFRFNASHKINLSIHAFVDTQGKFYGQLWNSYFSTPKNCIWTGMYSRKVTDSFSFYFIVSWIIHYASLAFVVCTRSYVDMQSTKRDFICIRLLEMKFRLELNFIWEF